MECRALYDVRRGRRALLGMFPTVALQLVRHGAPLGDVLAPLAALESAVIQERGRHFHASLADLQREETEANRVLDQAQLELAEHPNDRGIRERALEAAFGQRFATDVLIAKLTEREAES